MMLNTNKFLKKTLLLFFDFSLVIISICLAYFLRFENLSILNYIDLTNIIIPGLIFVFVLYYFNVYSTLTRFLSFEFLQILKIFIIFSFFYFTYVFILAEKINIFLNMDMYLGLNPPRSTIFSLPIIILVLFLFSRQIFSLVINFIFKNYKINSNRKQRCMIYGAGDLGNQLFNFLIKYKKNYIIDGIIDDNSYLQDQYIKKTKIISLEYFLKKFSRKEIIIFVAIKNYKENFRKNLLSRVSKYEKIRVIFVKDNDGVLNINSINPSEVDVNFILGYSQELEKKKLKFLENKNILVTGGGGSIGSELVKQIYDFEPQSIYVVDLNEHNLFKISHFFKNKKNKKTKLKFCLGNLANIEYAKLIFKKKFDYVFHSAAYKHVSLVEDNIISAVENNILTTFNLCKLSQNKVTQFVNISSDKAVKPKSFMGATKNISEQIINKYNNISKNTNFYSVRFGNVLNSSGSVIPIFQEQILKNEKLTITNINATRYFMSINEAIHLILTTLIIKNKGKTFYFDMGKPIKIFNLAKKIANFYGKNLVKIPKNINEIGYKITGLTKGEKLHEILTTPKNILQKTEIKKILSIKFQKSKFNDLDEYKFKQILKLKNEDKVKKYIFKIAQNID